MADMASAIRSEPRSSLLVLALAVGVIATLHHVWSAGSDKTSEPRPRHRRGVRAAIAVLVFGVAVGASGYAMLALSTPIASDTRSYWSSLADLVETTPGFISARTPLYQFVIAAIREMGGSSWNLLALQVGTRALACASVAWLLALTSSGAAMVVGILLALDPVGATMSVVYLAESLYTTGLLVSLVLLLSQLERSDAVRRRELVTAGVLFGWAFLFRPAGMALIVPVCLAYAISRRSVADAGVVLGGFCLVGGAIALLNLFRAGVFAIAATGPYLSYPLFIHDLLDADNGPTSARMVATLDACQPGWREWTITAGSSNADIQGKLWPCFQTDSDKVQQQDSRYRPSFGALYRGAYVEAVVAHPLRYARKMSLEMARFLSTAVAHYPAGIRGFSRRIDLHALCRREGPHVQFFRSDFTDFFCPTMIVPDPVRNAAVPDIGFRTRMVYQPYLAVYDPHTYVRSYRETPVPEMAGAAGLLFFVLVFATARPSYRPWVAGAALVVLYSAAATAVGQVATRRYAAVTSPFLLIVSGLFLVTVVEDVWRLVSVLVSRCLPTRPQGPPT